MSIIERIRGRLRPLAALEDDVNGYCNAVTRLDYSVDEIIGMMRRNTIGDRIGSIDVCHRIRVLDRMCDGFADAASIRAAAAVRWAHPRKYPRLMLRLHAMDALRAAAWDRLDDAINRETELMVIERYANKEETR